MMKNLAYGVMVLGVVAPLLSGCAATNVCVPATYGYSVAPAASTVSVGSQQQFVASLKVVTPSSGPCVMSAAVLGPYQDHWTSSDPVNAPIDTTPGAATNGVLSCKGATTGPVTVTATYPLGGSTASATVSCQ